MKFPILTTIAVLLFLSGALATGIPGVIAVSDAHNDAKLLATESLHIAARAHSLYDICHERAQANFPLYDAVIDVAEIPYRNPGANCYDHSKMLQERLREEDIQSSIYVNHDRSHAWVAVWINATTGRFVTLAESATAPFGPVLEIRGFEDNHEVICSR